MMLFTLYDTISGDTILEHAQAEDVMKKLGMTEERF